MVEYQNARIIIEDISSALPRRGTWPARTSAIRSATCHHTGGSTRVEGLKAAMATAGFCIERDDPETKDLEGRSWPAICYTFFLPFICAVRDGRIVIYRCLPDEEAAWQAGWWNAESFAVTFQGGLPGWRPSGMQKDAWRELHPYLCERYGFDLFELQAHQWRGKPSCPGREIVGWLHELREAHPDHIRDEVMLREALAMALDQPHLLNESADPHGWELRRAISAFQKSRRIRDSRGKYHPALAVDGAFGLATESELRRELKRLGAH